MKLDKWLIVSDRGAARVTANRPALEPHEIAVHLLMQIPDALFRRPTVEARIVIPPDAAPPATLDAEVIGQVREAIEGATGLRVELAVAAADGPEEAP